MDAVNFFKMSASGNDFIVIDNRDGSIDAGFPDIPDFVQKACRRRHSVGADGMILLQKSEKHDFSWRFYNADGSEAEMCGNGGRCAARFAHLKGIAGPSMAFDTLAGTMKAEVEDRRVKLQLTTPTDLKLDYPIQLESKEIFVSSVNTGVPHVILLADDIDRAPVEELGRAVRYHKFYSPKGTNVDFVKIIDRENIKIRTYERGVEGETYACGTGAVAVGAVLKEKGLVQKIVNVWTKGGEVIRIYVDGDVYLEGSARVIYAGELWPEALD
jgi:diaminopimelate epimerase